MGDLAELNFDAITVEDAELLYWQDKRLLINDGHVVGITQLQEGEDTGEWDGLD